MFQTNCGASFTSLVAYLFGGDAEDGVHLLELHVFLVRLRPVVGHGLGLVAIRHENGPQEAGSHNTHSNHTADGTAARGRLQSLNPLRKSHLQNNLRGPEVRCNNQEDRGMMKGGINH
jgi:hypothetical protein